MRFRVPRKTQESVALSLRTQAISPPQGAISHFTKRSNAHSADTDSSSAPGVGWLAARPHARHGQTGSHPGLKPSRQEQCREPDQRIESSVDELLHQARPRCGLRYVMRSETVVDMRLRRGGRQGYSRQRRLQPDAAGSIHRFRRLSPMGSENESAEICGIYGRKRVEPASPLRGPAGRVRNLSADYADVRQWVRKKNRRESSESADKPS